MDTVGLRAAIGLALLALTFLTFAPAGRCDFIGYDDPLYIKHPRVLQGLSGENVLWAMVATDAANWHPLTWLSHMLDAELWGSNPRPPHLINVGLHALNAAVLFFVLHQLTARTWLSTIVASLFALHPLRVESVAWVAERKDLLCALFFFLSIGAYVSCVRRPSVVRYGVLVMTFVLALMSKPMAVTLPCVLLLLDYWPLRRFENNGAGEAPARIFGRLVAEKLPLFVISAAACLLTMAAQAGGGAVVALQHMPLGDRIVNASIGYMRYAGKTIWPTNLTLLYPLEIWSATTIVASVAAVVIISALALRSARRLPYLAVGWLWFLGTLVPVIGLVQVGSQSIADRYTYIPTIGLMLALVWGIAAVVERWRWTRIAASVAVVIALVACAMLTQRQLGVWQQGTLALFRQALEVNERNGVAHYQVAHELSKLGKSGDAMTHALRARELAPRYNKPHYLVGNLLRDRGELRDAVASYQKSLQLDPNFWMAWQDLAVAQAKAGDYAAAETSLKRALELNPTSELLKRDLAALPHTPTRESATTRPAVTSTQ